MEKILKIIIDSPKLVIVFFSTISIFFTIYSLNNLTINTSTDALINKNLNFKKNQDKLKKDFPILANNILIRVSGDEEDEINNSLNYIINKLSERKELNFLYSPNKDKIFKENYFIFLNDYKKKQLIQRLYDFQPFLSEINNNTKLKGFNNLLSLSIKNETTAESLNKFSNIFEIFFQSLKKKNNVDWENLLNDSQRSSFIIFGLNEQYIKNNGFSEFYDFLKTLSGKKNGKLKIEFTGGLPIDFEEMMSVSKGASIAGFLSLILVTLILWFGIKNLKVIIFLSISIIFGLLITIGLTTLFVGSLNLISVAFAVLFIGLSVDYGIQVYLRINEEIRKKSKEFIIEKTKNIASTLLIASIPSMIGFLSFVPTDYNGLSELGLISFFGLIVGLMVNLTFLPSLLILFPKGIEEKHKKYSNIYKKLYTNLEKNKNVFLIFFVFIMFFTFSFLKKINFDSDALNLKDPKLASVKLAKELIEDNPTSDYIISIMLDNISSEKKKLDQLLSEESVRSFFSYSSFTKDFKSDELAYIQFLISSQRNTNFFSDPSEIKKFIKLLEKFSHLSEADVSFTAKKLINIIKKEFSTSESSKELETLLFEDFDKLMKKIEGFGKVGIDFSEKIPSYYSKRFLSGNGVQRIEIYPSKDVSKKENLKEFVLDVQKYFPNATGMPVVQFEAGEIVIKSFLKAMLLSFSFLIIFIFCIFKKSSLVFLTLIPIFISSILTIFFMIIFRLDFNFANMIAIPLLYSLGITYSIYFLKRFLELGKLVPVISSNTPKAIIFSALTTIASFSTLAISSHNGTSSMGILLFISLFNTLIASVFFLPLIIGQIENKFFK